MDLVGVADLEVQATVATPLSSRISDGGIVSSMLPAFAISSAFAKPLPGV